MNTLALLRRRALRVAQPGREIYQFTLTASELLVVADISRIGRDDAGRIIGYQRPSVRRHVNEIAAYISGGDAVFPNAIILALSSRARFVQSRGPNVSDGIASGGTIEIPLPAVGDARPAWIVDGQQRALALDKAGVRDLAVPVTAFIADDVAFQRDQFLRINNARPLPRGLLTELLPEMSSPLPARVAARQVPSLLCDALNLEDCSPFQGLIRRPSGVRSDSRRGVVADTALVTMLQDRFAGGCLFPYRNETTGETDVESAWRIVLAYWQGVRATFPDAWGRPSSESRLMHSVGILAMGRLMDEVMRGADPFSTNLSRHVEAELAHVAPVCRWTHGEWEGLRGTAWNEVENTTRARRMLANFLVRTHAQARVAVS